MELLDGAMGTELRRRGYELRAPLFASAALVDAPDLVTQIHADYLRAGATVVTTNSFMLGATGTGLGTGLDTGGQKSLDSPEQLAKTSVALARTAVAHVGALARIAGNLGPHDSDAANLRAIATALVQAGADLLLIETATSVEFCQRALTACADLGVPVWLSCAWKDARFLSGEDPSDLVEPTLDAPSADVLRPDLLACNCFEFESLDANLAALDKLARAWGVPQLGVWPNLSRTDDAGFHAVAHGDVSVTRALAAAVRRYPALTLVGSCCGSTPATTSALRRGFS